MTEPRTVPRKRKRGANRWTLVEDNDDAFDIVSVKEVIKETPAGPVKTLVEVPLRPIAGSPAGQSSQPQPVTAAEMQDFDAAVPQIVDDSPIRESSKNKVVDIGTVQRDVNQIIPATILDGGIC